MTSVELALDSDRPAIERLLTEGGLPLVSTYVDGNPHFGAPMSPVTFLLNVSSSVLTSFLHNWPFLFLGIPIAVALKVYMGTGRVEVFMRRRTSVAHPEWVGGAE